MLKEQLIKRETIKKDLKELRDRFGKSMTKVSEESGISLTTIWTIENGSNDKFLPETIYKLNKYFEKLAEQENK